MKEIPAPCRRLVLIPPINEMLRLRSLATAQATVLTFALYLRSSESLCLCQDQVVGLEQFFCTPKRSMSSKVNVFDESLLLDNPEYKFFELVLEKTRGWERGAASSLPPLS